MLNMLNRQELTLVKQLLETDEAFATTLMAIVLDQYGVEALQWTPQTIVAELRDDFGATLSEENVAKLGAAMTLLTSDDFYKRLPRFVTLCNALAGGASSDDFEKADAAECAWALVEGTLIDPPPPEEEDPEPFVPEIRRYLGAVLDEEGIVNPPDMLRLAIRDTPSGEPDYSGFDLENPSMFAAEYGVAADRAAEIAEMVQTNLRSLFSQLAQLPLKNGNGRQLLEQLRNNISKNGLS